MLKAKGRDTKGQGNASALITATLVPDAQGTKVTVHTDLSVTGKVAQFGRGIMADVSTKLLNQFVEQLETTILAGNAGEAAKHEAAEPAKPDAPVAMATAEPEAAPPPNAEATPTIRRLDHPEPEPVDLVGSAGASVAKRVVPVVIGGLLILLFARGVRRRHRGQGADVAVDDVAVVTELLGRAPRCAFDVVAAIPTAGRRDPKRPPR